MASVRIDGFDWITFEQDKAASPSEQLPACACAYTFLRFRKDAFCKGSERGNTLGCE
jgi:hypothetical protein